MATQNEGAKIVGFMPELAGRSRQADGMRHEICRICKLDWCVSRQARIPKGGYVCSWCSMRDEKGGKENESTHK